MNTSAGRFMLGLLVGVLLGAAAMYTLVGGAGGPAVGQTPLERGPRNGSAPHASTPPAQQISALPADPSRSAAPLGESDGAVSDSEVSRVLAAVKVAPPAASGVRAIVATSFARIFYRNSINLGLPVIECDGAARAIADDQLVRIDLERGELHTPHATFRFPPYPAFVLELIRDGGLIAHIARKS